MSSSTSGPIEYVGKADRKAGRNADRKAAKKTPGGGSRLGCLWSLLAVLGFFGAVIAYVRLGGYVRATLLGLACDLSACSVAGMTVAGWLIIATPAAMLLLTAVLWPRLAKRGRVALGIASAVVVLIAFTFLPGRERDLSDLVKGPGSEAAGDGIMWAFGGAGAALLFLLVLVYVGKAVPAVDRHYNTVATFGAVALMIAALPVAISKSDPTWVRAADVFPDELSMNGDRLVRTAVAEQRGCDGVLPDDKLLNLRNCYLTVRAVYTTDDSDAVATFRAVLYADDETADEVRDGLPRGLAPVGVTGGAITVMSTTREWVLIGTAGHADGHPIAEDERPWVLWPLRQVSYHFIGVQGGLLAEPDPAGEIHPRTR
ncbi:hypothetical protein Cme02nite_43740 [Catellatospora methionotrophica]|uniref:Uncharacterized protein n=1 Tax=Catellatospora methionotrophica TaxID=121620 RepID=A0A8J3LBI0_9ACTN|nr:hypothetical protein [Catellatospora methionotrophica]GIG16042.1 hypothetical protein Cme02nite_43740 [Catellatospora methionotrophica]